MAQIDLRFLLSINSENGWSDLLATLLDADPVTTRRLLNIEADVPLTVRREVAKPRGRKASDRPDLIVESGGRILAVIEVKLLAGLGAEQLERYWSYVGDSDRANCRFVAVSLQRLRLNTAHASEWQNLTWEELIAHYVKSPMTWVSETAVAWLSHIESRVPAVDGETVWNEIEGIDLYLALRLRAAFIYENVDVPPGSSKSLLEIGSGRLYVAIVDAPIRGSNYSVRWETTESLPTQAVGRLTDGGGLRGVEIRFFLVQRGVTTSRNYDWDHLSLLWHAYLKSEAWIPWRTNPPQKRVQWERDGISRLRSLDSPKFLGSGYGDGQAKLSGEVVFGARFVLSPTTTLAEATAVLNRVALIGSRMAQHSTRPKPVRE